MTWTIKILKWRVPWLNEIFPAVYVVNKSFPKPLKRAQILSCFRDMKQSLRLILLSSPSHSQPSPSQAARIVKRELHFFLYLHLPAPSLILTLVSLCPEPTSAGLASRSLQSSMLTSHRAAGRSEFFPLESCARGGYRLLQKLKKKMGHL